MFGIKVVIKHLSKNIDDLIRSQNEAPVQIFRRFSVDTVCGFRKDEMVVTGNPDTGVIGRAVFMF